MGLYRFNQVIPLWAKARPITKTSTMKSGPSPSDQTLASEVDGPDAAKPQNKAHSAPHGVIALTCNGRKATLLSWSPRDVSFLYWSVDY